jgi:hypothetical protein
MGLLGDEVSAETEHLEGAETAGEDGTETPFVEAVTIMAEKQLRASRGKQHWWYILPLPQGQDWLSDTSCADTMSTP